MEEKVDHDVLDAALKRCGASWDAAQTHGLLAGRLAVAGAQAGPDWLLHVLEGTDESDAFRLECQKMLDKLYQSTFWQLSERLSEFVPLLPDDDSETIPGLLELSDLQFGPLNQPLGAADTWRRIIRIAKRMSCHSDSSHGNPRTSRYSSLIAST